MTDKQYIWAFEMYRMKVFYYCKSMLKNTQDSEDATSIVFIKLWERHENIQFQDAGPLLFTYARNKCLDIIKVRDRRELRYASYNEDIQERAESNDPISTVLDLIYHSMKTLTPQQKEIFTMKIIEGKDYEEICSTLNIKIQTARTTVHNALERMRKTLKEQGVGW